MLTQMEFQSDPRSVWVSFVDNQELAYAVNDTWYEFFSEILARHGYHRDQITNVPIQDLFQTEYIMGEHIQEMFAEQTGFCRIEIEQEQHDITQFYGTSNAYKIQDAIPGHMYVRFCIVDITAFCLWMMQNNLTGILPDEHSSSIRTFLHPSS